MDTSDPSLAGFDSRLIVKYRGGGPGSNRTSLYFGRCDGVCVEGALCVKDPEEDEPVLWDVAACSIGIDLCR
jgi:hypothetical protein